MKCWRWIVLVSIAPCIGDSLGYNAPCVIRCYTARPSICCLLCAGGKDQNLKFLSPRQFLRPSSFSNIVPSMHPGDGVQRTYERDQAKSLDGSSESDDSSEVDQMWDAALDDHEPQYHSTDPQPSEKPEAHRTTNNSGRQPLSLILDPYSRQAWEIAGTIVKRRHPILDVLLLQSTARWLSGERKLVQRVRTFDLPEYNQDDDKVPPAGSPHFDLGKRYVLKGMAGKGAFAKVGWGFDLVTGEQSAFKRVVDVLPDRAAAKRLMREVSLLRRVRGHPNILSIKDLLVRDWKLTEGNSPPRLVTDVYLVSEFMPADLAHMLDSGFIFSVEQVRSLTWQLLRALRHMHECGVVHRDLKPGNILVNKFWHLEVCDLGIARTIGLNEPPSADPSADRRFTDYVVTRPYRAPELLMGSRSYTESVDMWAAGCLFAEMLASLVPVEQASLTRNTSAGPQRLPLFPGMDHKDMMRRIIGLVGHPRREVLERMSAWEPHARDFVDRLPYPACDLDTRHELQPIENPVAPYCRLPTAATAGDDTGVEWRAVFPWAEEAATELLAQLLQYDPAQRISAAQALRHPYFRSVPGLEHGDARPAVPAEAGGSTAGVAAGTGGYSERDADLAMRRACVRSKSSWNYFWLRRDQLHHTPL